MAVHDEALDAELTLERDDALSRARSGLLNFTRYTYPQFEVAWHNRQIARTLNRFAQGLVPRLMIFTAPRHGKSELVSRRCPAWLLGLDPDLQVMLTSYSAKLADKMNLDVQRIITSPKYKELFPATRIAEKGIEALGTWRRNQDYFEVVGRRGYFRSAGVGGSLTGEGADVGFIDDPVKNWDEALSEVYREKVWNWYTSTFLTRLSKNGRVLLTCTRWHEDDLAGRILKRAENDPEADQWEVLRLPALKEGTPTDVDPRAEGEALWPERFPVRRLVAARAASLRVFTSLYQQRPSPPQGNLVARDAWRFYRRGELPEDGLWNVSADLNLKDRKESDNTVYLEWLESGARYYITRRVKKPMNYVEMEDTFVAFCLNAGHTVSAKWIEDAALAQALVGRLSARIPGLIPVPVTTGKLQRAEAVVPYINSGNVFLPHPDDEAWVVDFIEEWANFPHGKHDDQVDATSLGLLQMAGAVDDLTCLPGEVNKHSDFLSL